MAVANISAEDLESGSIVEFEARPLGLLDATTTRRACHFWQGHVNSVQGRLTSQELLRQVLGKCALC